MKQSPILIIGKNGKTGARVNQRLQALGYATRAVSRATTPAFDWEKPATWHSAIAGTRVAYVTYQPDLAVPDAEATIKEFVRVAADAGLQHIVLLSGRGEAGAVRAEQILIHSGMTWNVVRASWFAQNFSESFMLDGILAGELALPAGDTVEPFIDVEDIADVAVAALTEAGHRNKLFEVSGPRALSFADCIEEISAAIGRPLKYTRAWRRICSGYCESCSPWCLTAETARWCRVLNRHWAVRQQILAATCRRRLHRVSGIRCCREKLPDFFLLSPREFAGICLSNTRTYQGVRVVEIEWLK